MHPRLIPLLAFALGALAPGRLRATEPWPAILDPFTVRTLHVQIEPTVWEAIKRDTNFYDPELNIRTNCLLWVEGAALPPNQASNALTVQIRRKSDPALPSESNPEKVSLKIDVNEYVPGQELWGLRKISLENGSGNGVLKEGFAMNLHGLAADAGFYEHQAFRAAWVRLVVNGRYVGLYSSPEQRDASFLRNRGQLREQAAWLYEINGGIFLDTTVNTTNSPTHAHLDYLPFRAPNPPPANFEEDVQAWVDVPAMLTMAAIEAFIANTDGLFTKSASNQGKNSFSLDFLPSTQHRRFYLPWDLDGGFSNTSWDIFNGGAGSSGARQYQRRFLDHYWFGEVYRQIFTELIEGPHSPAALNAWLDRLEPVLGPAIAEDPNCDSGQFASLRNYIAARVPNVRGQIGPIIRAPGFACPGGEIAPGFPLRLSHTNTTGASEIWYTLDGSDPRLPGGGVSPSALAYAGPVVPAGDTLLTARVRNVNGATTRWSHLRREAFHVAGSLDGVRFTEVMYHPRAGAGFEDEDEFEFIELQNTGAGAARLDHCRFTGVDFQFAPGTSLAPGARLVVVANPVAFAQRYPGVAHAGVYFRSLSNSGENLRLTKADGTVVDALEFEAKPPWPLGAAGFGHSLVRIDPLDAGADASHWRASAAVHGSPGAADSAPPFVPGLVFNEILARTSFPLEDAVELYNPTAGPIDIGGWWFSDDLDPLDPLRAALRKYRIPAGTVVPAGGHLVLYEGDFNPAAPTAAALDPFGLSQDGETVYLSSADAAGNLTGHIIGQKFGAMETNRSWGRAPTSAGSDFTPLSAPTFGADAATTREEFRTGAGLPNAAPSHGPVAIHEIHHQPAAGSAGFVELLNFSTNTVDLGGWMLDGAGGQPFPPGTQLAPGGFLLLLDTNALTEAAFRSTHAVPAGVPVVTGSFTFDDDGEELELLRPNSSPTRPGLRVDRVKYNDKAPWPVPAAGAGPSLERRDATAHGNDPLNWVCTVNRGSPGSANGSPGLRLIAAGNRWNHRDGCRDPGAAWRGLNHADDAWPGGFAPLGFGAPVATVTPFGGNPDAKHATTYFRRAFAVPVEPAGLTNLVLRVNHGDGFVAYLNGAEVARRNLPPGALPHTSFAQDQDHGVWREIPLDAHRGLLVRGRNLLAVEVHLSSAADPGLYWDAELSAELPAPSGDTDRDGLPDTWETDQFGDLDETAAGDPDADGTPNAIEFQLGLDPLDPASRFALTVRQDASGNHLEWPSAPGVGFTVERSLVSPATGWQVIATPAGTAATAVLTDTPPGNPARAYYRVRIP